MVSFMSERPQLSKSELKKMFLRVLYECLYGKMQSHSHGIDSIVPSWMNEYFKIEMTAQEIQLTHEAIQELKNSGLIVQDSTQREEVFQILTAKGKEIVEKQQDPDVYGLRLEEVVKNEELLFRCLGPFNDGDYEHAVFKAFKLVEETVRKKAGLSEADMGVDLMSKALNPSSGKLIIPTCLLPAEQEGVHSLFRGAIAFLKNPSSHRTVNYENRLVAIQTIVLAELLLSVLSTAKLKS
jgi:uncharacterized protein (TIGR02391 family)